jgi:hypothetical protein
MNVMDLILLDKGGCGCQKIDLAGKECYFERGACCIRETERRCCFFLSMEHLVDG